MYLGILQKVEAVFVFAQKLFDRVIGLIECGERGALFWVLLQVDGVIDLLLTRGHLHRKHFGVLGFFLLAFKLFLVNICIRNNYIIFNRRIYILNEKCHDKSLKTEEKTTQNVPVLDCLVCSDCRLVCSSLSHDQ